MCKNIVIEGPNNVGKTTFIEELLELEQFKDWRVEHLTADSPSDYYFYDATLKNCDKTIFDRHCIGETIYPYLVERDANITCEDVVKLIESHTDTLFIFITADLNFIHKAYIFKDETPNWYYVTEERRLFDSAYRKLKEKKNVVLYINEWIDERDLVEFLRSINL